MIFYKYTLNKMVKSISTYVTGLFGIIPILISGILAVTGNGAGYALTSLIILATFPLFVVFITFKTVQVFRDEIENQTMLTIVSKPLPRKKLVLEGLLSLFTIITILAFVGLFIPMLGFLRTEPNIGEVFLKAILITLTTILLGSIIASLGMLLSLKIKGKAFIGIMLAIFGIGFYALWGIMTFMRFTTSRAGKLASYEIETPGLNVDKELSEDGKKTIYNITGKKNYNDQDYSEAAEDIYDHIVKLGNFQAMDAVKWFDPTLHWQVMYNGGTSVKKLEGAMTLLKSAADVNVNIDHSKTENGEIKTGTVSDDENEVHYRVTASIEKSVAVPLYYPFILWTLIGGIVIGLSFVILNKSNIS